MWFHLSSSSRSKRLPTLLPPSLWRKRVIHFQFLASSAVWGLCFVEYPPASWQWSSCLRGIFIFQEVGIHKTTPRQKDFGVKGFRPKLKRHSVTPIIREHASIARVKFQKNFKRYCATKFKLVSWVWQQSSKRWYIFDSICQAQFPSA